MTTTTVPTVTEELIRQLEQEITVSASLRCPASIDPVHLSDLLAERADHLQQLAAAAITAERYQWIRDKHNDEKGGCWVSVWDKDMPGWVSLDKAYVAGFELFEDPLDLDAAVDAARAVADD